MKGREDPAFVNGETSSRRRVMLRLVSERRLGDRGITVAGDSSFSTCCTYLALDILDWLRSDDGHPARQFAQS